MNITPKKKVVKITIDRELVVKPKEKKEKEKGNAKRQAAGEARLHSVRHASSVRTASSAAALLLHRPPHRPPQLTPAPKRQAEIAAAPPAEALPTPKAMTTTTSQAHSNKLLQDALG